MAVEALTSGKMHLGVSCLLSVARILDPYRGEIRRLGAGSPEDQKDIKRRRATCPFSKPVSRFTAQYHTVPTYSSRKFSRSAPRRPALMVEP